MGMIEEYIRNVYVMTEHFLDVKMPQAVHNNVTVEPYFDMILHYKNASIVFVWHTP